MAIVKNYTYPLDQTGRDPQNLVKDEKHTITDTNRTAQNVLVPKFAPFFRQSLVVIDMNSGNQLIEGVDYMPVWAVVTAGKDTEGYTPLYGGIQFIDSRITGQFKLQYQTIGGGYTINSVEIAQALANQANDPLMTSYEDVIGKPLTFPPLEHVHSIEDFVGFKDVEAKLQGIIDALTLLAAEDRDNHPGYQTMVEVYFSLLDRHREMLQAFDDLSDETAEKLRQLDNDLTDLINETKETLDNKINDNVNRLTTNLNNVNNRLTELINNNYDTLNKKIDDNKKATDNAISDFRKEYQENKKVTGSTITNNYNTLNRKIDNVNSTLNTKIDTGLNTLNSTITENKRVQADKDKGQDDKIKALENITSNGTFVKRTGNEDISGVKTFNNEVKFKSVNGTQTATVKQDAKGFTITEPLSNKTLVIGNDGSIKHNSKQLAYEEDLINLSGDFNNWRKGTANASVNELNESNFKVKPEGLTLFGTVVNQNNKADLGMDGLIGNNSYDANGFTINRKEQVTQFISIGEGYNFIRTNDTGNPDDWKTEKLITTSNMNSILGSVNNIVFTDNNQTITGVKNFKNDVRIGSKETEGNSVDKYATVRFNNNGLHFYDPLGKKWLSMGPTGLTYGGGTKYISTSSTYSSGSNYTGHIWTSHQNYGGFELIKDKDLDTQQWFRWEVTPNTQTESSVTAGPSMFKLVRIKAVNEELPNNTSGAFSILFPSKSGRVILEDAWGAKLDYGRNAGKYLKSDLGTYWTRSTGYSFVEQAENEEAPYVVKFNNATTDSYRLRNLDNSYHPIFKSIHHVRTSATDATLKSKSTWTVGIRNTSIAVRNDDNSVNNEATYTLDRRTNQQFNIVFAEEENVKLGNPTVGITNKNLQYWYFNTNNGGFGNSYGSYTIYSTKYNDGTNAFNINYESGLKDENNKSINRRFIFHPNGELESPKGYLPWIENSRYVTIGKSNVDHANYAGFQVKRDKDGSNEQWFRFEVTPHNQEEGITAGPSLFKFSRQGANTTNPMPAVNDAAKTATYVVLPPVSGRAVIETTHGAAMTYGDNKNHYLISTRGTSWGGDHRWMDSLSQSAPFLVKFESNTNKETKFRNRKTGIYSLLKGIMTVDKTAGSKTNTMDESVEVYYRNSTENGSVDSIEVGFHYLNSDNTSNSIGRDNKNNQIFTFKPSRGEFHSSYGGYSLFRDITNNRFTLAWHNGSEYRNIWLESDGRVNTNVGYLAYDGDGFIKSGKNITGNSAYTGVEFNHTGQRYRVEMHPTERVFQFSRTAATVNGTSYPAISAKLPNKDGTIALLTDISPLEDKVNKALFTRNTVDYNFLNQNFTNTPVGFTAFGFGVNATTLKQFGFDAHGAGGTPDGNGFSINYNNQTTQFLSLGVDQHYLRTADDNNSQFTLERIVTSRSIENYIKNSTNLANATKWANISDKPTNFVTTNTTQTITADKTFNDQIYIKNKNYTGSNVVFFTANSNDGTKAGIGVRNSNSSQVSLINFQLPTSTNGNKNTMSFSSDQYGFVKGSDTNKVLSLDMSTANQADISYTSNSGTNVIPTIRMKNDGTVNLIRLGSSGTVKLGIDGIYVYKATQGSYNVLYTDRLSVEDLYVRSDRRLKENIKPIKNALDIIDRLKGRTFDWKMSGRHTAGFIAQEVEKVLPDIVTENKEGTKSVNYVDVIAYLVEALKEEKKAREKLENKVDKLEEMVHLLLTERK